MYSILVVEDDPYLSEALKTYGELNGYAITLAGTGSMGCRMMLKKAFDGIIFDLTLPDAKGVELMVNLQSQSRYLAPRASVCFSVCDDRNTIDTLYMLGIDAFVSKPSSFRKLFSTVQRAILAKKESALNHYG